MNKTVASVIDEINQWAGPHGDVFYVTAIFTDESVGSVGRKDHDAALEVQGLLRESIGQPQDFTLEPAGQTKTGREKFKIKGFGTVGGAPTYVAPGVQGGGGPADSAPVSRKPRPPEHDVDANIRAAVALKAAVEYVRAWEGSSHYTDVLGVAESFDDWLQQKASEPASSAYTEGGGREAAPPRGSPEQAGVGSEITSSSRESVDNAALDPAGGQAPLGGDIRGEGVGESTVDRALGEGTPASSLHTEHDWQPHPQLRGKLKCDCGAMRNKVA